MPNFINSLLLVLITLMFCACGESPKDVAENYLRIVASEEPDEIKAEKVYAIINETDRKYISDLAQVYVTMDEEKWREDFQNSFHKYTKPQLFANGLASEIKDSLSFRNMLLRTIILNDKAAFENAKYLREKQIDPSITKVVYGVKTSGKYGVERALNVFTLEGENTLLFTLRMDKYEKEIARLRKIIGKQAVELQNDVLNMLKEKNE